MVSGNSCLYFPRRGLYCRRLPLRSCPLPPLRVPRLRAMIPLPSGRRRRPLSLRTGCGRSGTNRVAILLSAVLVVITARVLEFYQTRRDNSIAAKGPGDQQRSAEGVRRLSLRPCAAGVATLRLADDAYSAGKFTDAANSTRRPRRSSSRLRWSPGPGSAPRCPSSRRGTRRVGSPI
jgi:hypothetical protein